MASAPSGWRAIYKVEKPEPGEPDWMAAAHRVGVFHLTNHMSAEDADWSRVVGDVIEGVVIDGMGTPACALMAPNFLFYLGPDDPDPDSDQLNTPVRQPAAAATTGRV